MFLKEIRTQLYNLAMYVLQYVEIIYYDIVFIKYSLLLIEKWFQISFDRSLQMRYQGLFLGWDHLFKRGQHSWHPLLSDGYT
jgi:hypothetical protein